MDRPPRPREERLLNGHVLGRAFGFLGPVEAFGSMILVPIGAAVFFGWSIGQALPSEGIEQETLSAMVFAAIVVMQMANAFECRSDPASLFAIGPFTNRLLVGAVVVEGLALLGFIYIAPLAQALGGAPLGVAQWAMVAVTPFLLVGAEEARKAVVRRRAGLR
jgi:magnesium-transporting ATPase (P-type)